MSSRSTVRATVAPESRSGLDPWVTAELPAPPRPKGLECISIVGPGIIVLGVSIGSGEFLLGPAVFVRHGLSLLWVTSIAVVLQAVFNTELMRYTLATGEPVFTGFMRTRASSTLWALIYHILFLLPLGGQARGADTRSAELDPRDHDSGQLSRAGTIVRRATHLGCRLGGTCGLRLE